MRTYKKLLTLLLCGLLAATVASAQTLVLRHANGALTQMPLTSETSITFDDGKTVVGNRAYAASDIVSIAYKDETMPVEGDVNGDTQVNVGDIMAIINYMAGQANMGVDVADVNGDGNVNVGDVMSVINIMAGYNLTTCPDASHPHWIDLGLPSGTQWRCCNEGTSTPEGYGGYYTFDEAQAYNPPSLDQIKELVENCSYAWTTQNGVKGGKFTGLNGGTIFLPAAGRVWYGELDDVGSRGDYWSSSPYGEDGAIYLSFYSGYPNWGNYGWRSYGQSVRPVR